MKLTVLHIDLSEPDPDEQATGYKHVLTLDSDAVQPLIGRASEVELRKLAPDDVLDLLTPPTRMPVWPRSLQLRLSFPVAGPVTLWEMDGRDAVEAVTDALCNAGCPSERAHAMAEAALAGLADWATATERKRT